MAETGLFLDGLRCTGCVNRVERALREAKGVVDASVNYTSHRALVDFDADRTDVQSLVSCVEGLGYSATPYDPAALERGPQTEARRALVRVLIAAFLAGNVMLLSAALYIGSYQGLEPEMRRFLRWMTLGLSLPAVAWCALPFWRGAIRGLRRWEITMDVPIVLGVAISFAVGIAGTLAEADHLYMDSAAMIVFLILLGRTLEARSRARASGAVDRLSALAPATAYRRTPAGLEEVPVAELDVGDRVAIAAGQRIPVDGTVMDGSTEVDESLLTGESQPVLRKVGESVVGGSLNTLCEIEIQVTERLTTGTLARLSALLERAQSERPEIQRLADRVASVFAPAVVVLAALTAIYWWIGGASPFETALTAAAVLIVACPCALGLATPAAVTAAIGRAAQLGILVKSGEALERCSRVGAVLLDKTGTVTTGCFSVEEVVCAPGVTRSTILSTAAAAEGASIHPVAEALRLAAKETDATVRECATRQTLPGRGVEAEVDGERWLVGSRELLAERSIAVDATLEEGGAKLAERGLSLAWVAVGAEALGVVALADLPRADAASAVTHLRDLGLSVTLVSGDHPPAVALTAERAGIREWLSEVSPESKVEEVSEIRRRGGHVLVAGDGINDAAALAAADVGVAMAKGSDVTLHAADIVVRAPRLTAIAVTISLARATMRRIRENLTLALVYNAVAIPLAMTGILQPLHAAIAMSLSSVVVTANAARLLGWKPPS